MSRKKVFSLITLLLFAVSIMAANNGFVLILDAGHGGHDQGASGAISHEKDLTLKYALAFGKMVERNCPDVKVYYTRTSDSYVTLAGRAEFANKRNANLFVSVHINAMPGGRLAHGYQTYTLGRSLRNGNSTGIEQNLEVAKRENSVIFMEKDYKKTYGGLDQNSAESDIMFEFIQDENRVRSTELAKNLQNSICVNTGRQNAGARQDNLAVLRLTSMPACLMELGFISTPDEEQFLNSDEAVKEYSRGFLQAFNNYRAKYDNNFTVPYKPANEIVKEDNKIRTPVNVVEKVTGRKPVFKIQILTSSVQLGGSDSRFKELAGISSYEEDGMYKYTYGESNNYNEIYRLRKQILDKFPEAFIIAFRNGYKMNVNEAIREFKKNR
jgi:N-acetylmuramoyl-L-alanine amidase